MLYDDMAELLDTVRPDAVAVEELFWGHNVTTGIGVSHGRGVILLAICKAAYAAFRVYAQSGQAGRRRLRQRGQASGHGDDAAHSADGKGRAAGRRGGRDRHRAVPRALVDLASGAEGDTITMFYYLNGTVTLLDANLAVIDCGGVGYACHTSNYTLARLQAGQAGQALYLLQHQRGRLRHLRLLHARGAATASDG